MEQRKTPRAGETRYGIPRSIKLPSLNTVWNTLLSNPFALAADLCSAIIPKAPPGQLEILPEPIRYRLAHGMQTLSVEELTELTRCGGFCDAALYLTLKAMHGHPLRQVALLQEVADHVMTYGLTTRLPQYGEIIEKNLALFSASTGFSEVSGYSKLAAVNRMGPEIWGNRFSEHFREFYGKSTEPKTLMLVAYASLMGFGHLCQALPRGERAYVIIHKPDAPTTEALCVEREAHGCAVTKVPSLISLREALDNTAIYVIDDLIVNGDTIRGVRDFLVSHSVVSSERCRIGSIWGEVVA